MIPLILLQHKYRSNRYQDLSGQLEGYPDWVVGLAILVPMLILASLVLYFWIKKKKQR